MLDFAVVSVQMRGSGCSGGAFDLFDLPTTYDGYDAVETVATQPWVKGGKIGMAGISFSGISQLFVAGTRPPHLAAITPMSVVDDLYGGTGYPGGILNSASARAGCRSAWTTHDRRPGAASPTRASSCGWGTSTAWRTSA
jgi:putative CocE/NonD family hydrolase